MESTRKNTIYRDGAEKLVLMKILTTRFGVIYLRATTKKLMRKLLVLYCHNENDEFGKVVCEEWFKNDAIQNILSGSNFIVAGYNIPNESSKIKFLEKETSFDLRLSKIYIYVPIEGKMVSQAYIGAEEITQNDFVEQLKNIKEIFVNVIKTINDEKIEHGAEQTCESFQKLIFNSMEDKDFVIFSANEHQYLKEKIEFAYFGPPSSSEGCNEKQRKLIQKAFHVIMTQSDKYTNAEGVVVISFIFACCVNFVEINNNIRIKKDQFNHVPIFILRKCKRLPSYEQQNGDFCRIVIDSNLRVYSSWENFLSENKYPKGKVLYVPKNGEYQCDGGSLDCVYSYTPACGLGETLLSGLDHTSAIAGIGSGGLLLIAAIPAITLAPIAITGAVIAGAGAGIYSIGRSIANLIDRGTHDEDLSFLEAESRAAYVGIVTGALGFAGAGANVALAHFAKNGTNIGKTVTMSVNVLSKTNIAAGSVALGNSVYDVTRSYVVDGEEPSTLILVQLGASALFFGNSVYNYRDASTIVKEAQNSTLQKMNKDMRSNRHRKMFNKLQKETARLSNGNKATANAKVISTIRNANNVDDTMAILTRNNKRFNKLGIKISANNGQVSFNGQNMDVLKFAGAVNEFHISEVMSLSPEKMASSRFKSSFDVPWIELGLNLSQKNNHILDPSVVKFTRELLNIFGPYIQKKIALLMNKIWPTFSENSKESGLTINDILIGIIDWICAEVRDRLNLGSLGNGCVHVIQLLLNFYFCGKPTTQTVAEECSTFITIALSSKIANEEKIKLEQKEKEKKLENKRGLVKCSNCIGCYNQKVRR